MKELVGKFIEDIFINETKRELIFVCQDKDGHNAIKYFIEGDCCSTSYLESFDDISVLFDATVTHTSADNIWALSWNNIEHSDPDVDVLKAAFVILTTTKGRCTIEVRSESNGYYSGYIVVADDYTWDAFQQEVHRFISLKTSRW